MTDTILLGGTASGTYDFAGSVAWVEITAGDFTGAFGTPAGAFVSITVRPSTAGDDAFVAGTAIAGPAGGHRNAQITDMLRLADGRPVKSVFIRGDAAVVDATFTQAG